MGKKEYERAAEIVREFRRNNPPDPRSGVQTDNTDEIASHIEKSFIKLFNHFDSKGRFQQGRFLEACKVKG